MKYDHTEKAVALFTQGYNCAQSVFVAFSDVAGILYGEGTETDHTVKTEHYKRC